MMPDYDDLIDDYKGEEFEVVIAIRKPDGEVVQAAVIPEARISLVEAMDCRELSLTGTWLRPERPSLTARQFRITTLGGYTIHDRTVVPETKQIGDG